MYEGKKKQSKIIKVVPCKKLEKFVAKGKTEGVLCKSPLLLLATSLLQPYYHHHQSFQQCLFQTPNPNTINVEIGR